MTWRRRRAWIFDLDGTLTVPSHDFDAMKTTLGLPLGTSLLDGMWSRDTAARDALEAKVQAWERQHAANAVAAAGVHELLEALSVAGARLGVLTRNTRENALLTLEVTGMAEWLHADDVLGRFCAAPKPAPDGVQHLLARWAAPNTAAVMVGDYVDDIRAGRAAGTATVLLHAEPPTPWLDWADLTVPDLPSLHGAWAA